MFTWCSRQRQSQFEDDYSMTALAMSEMSPRSEYLFAFLLENRRFGRNASSVCEGYSLSLIIQSEDAQPLRLAAPMA